MSLKIRPESRVIVRAWGDEPVPQVLHRLENNGNTAFVGLETAVRPVGLPIEQVFRFDPDTFRGLRSAYESGDVRQLACLYAALEKNKVLDIMIPIETYSRHGQERVANPSGASAGSEQRGASR